MEDCELLEIDTNKPLIRHRIDLTTNPNDSSLKCDEERILTKFGEVLVAQQGAKFRRGSPQYCILTFHDLGLNHQSNFLAFFSYPSMKLVLDRIPVFHINAPGQERFADDLPADYMYPTMDELAELVLIVCQHYNIKHTICLGVGIGANVMSRFTAKNSELVDGLFLVNIVPTACGWLEWGYQKRNIYYLSLLDSKATTRSEFPQSIVSYLMWHHFGSSVEDRSSDLLNMYRAYFSSCEVNPKNLAMLIDAYIRRDDIGVERNTRKNIGCCTLIMTGNDSPHLDDSINMNSRIDPYWSTWMKLFDCSMVLDEQPAKVAQAFILFIQGLGLGLLNCVKI